MNRIVVIGASAGGVTALQQLAAKLPADFPAPLLVVLHVGSHLSMLPMLIAQSGALPASHAIDGEPLKPGHLHVAPPDRHMLVEGRTIRLTRGPKEHHARPAIDPLFRSAALAHGPAVIGVVLTGMLDDGTAGLQAIKACGGVTVVQDPDDALAPGMPQSALRHVEVDHCVPLAMLPRLLTSLASLPPVQAAPPAREVERMAREHTLTLETGTAIEHLRALGTPSTLACPDCHRDLWEITAARPPRYRCHTGHAFSLRSLQHALSNATDDTIWTALRVLQEKNLVLERLARLQQLAGEEEEARRLDALAGEVGQQVKLLRDLLEKTPDPVE